MNKGITLFFTGLSGSGKTTIANNFLKLEKYYNFIPQIVHLDGDVLRQGLCSDLGFSEEDRKENIRRVIELCKLLNDNGLMVLSTFIVPFNETRYLAKQKIENCKLIYVKTSLEECIKRDPKGLYKKALSGELKNFTGLDSPFEDPETVNLVDLVLNTQDYNIEQLVLKLWSRVLMWGGYV